MDQDISFSTSVLATLLKTNWPATDEERAIVLESMATHRAKLKVVEGQISEVIAHIEALKMQVEQAEIKLQRLREEEATILDSCSGHCQALAPFRNLPEDVVRNICVACTVEDDIIPLLAYRHTPMPYILGQICSGMRHVALTTPLIWAKMQMHIGIVSYHNVTLPRAPYAILAKKAIEWFERAGGLALTVILLDSPLFYEVFYDRQSHPARVFFDVLLSYSKRWKKFHFRSYRSTLSIPIIRIAALTAADLPLLQSVTLWFESSIPDPVLQTSELLKIPTLRHVTLENAFQMFTVNWAILTSVTLSGNTKNEIGRILQQTKCLEYCDIIVHCLEEHYTDEIRLPFLKTLIISDVIYSVDPPDGQSILGIITAPILEVFENHIEFVDLCLPDFLKRSTHLWKLSLMFFDNEKSLTKIMQLLRHCPLLTELSLRPSKPYGDIQDANGLLRAFAEYGDHGVICPRLQDFTCFGKIRFSLETLRIFLEAKQKDFLTPGLFPWRKVVIHISVEGSSQRSQEISDFVSQKKAEGLDINVYPG